MKRFGLIMSCLLSIPSFAQETEITILGITLNGADYSRATGYLDDLVTIWNQTAVGATGVTVRIANFGYPVPMESVELGLFTVDLPVAMGLAATERKDADIILFFSDVGVSLEGGCGYAQQINWTSYSGDPVGQRFKPTNGLDLRGRDNSHAAIIATESPCIDIPGVTIHEFGHLFGAGHEVGAFESPTDGYLYIDSHAKRNFFFFGMGPFRSIVSSGLLSDGMTPDPSSFIPLWSGSGLLAFDPTARNSKAVSTTAKSVANYRATAQAPLPPPPNPPPPPLPPGCTLQVPVNPVAINVPPACNPFPATRYNFYWDDLCPAAATHYVVEDQQPVVSGPWLQTGTSLWRGLAIGINGSPGFLRVSACNGTVCSAPSSSVLITDQC